MAQNINTRSMSEDEKIITVVRDYLNATSQATAVTMEEIIAKAIEVGFTTDCWNGVNGKKGYMNADHPWWFNGPVIAGVGTKEQLANHEDVHFHRAASKEKMNERVTREDDDNTRLTTVFRYWYDGNSFHTPVVRKSPKTKAEREEAKRKTEVRNFLDNLAGYVYIPKPRVKLERKSDGQIIDVSIEWIQKDPVKAATLYNNVEAVLVNA